MTPWRKLHRRLSQFTYLSEVESYADVFDAIDEAWVRGSRYEPGPGDQEVLGQISGTGPDGSEELMEFVVSRVPVTPVRTSNTMRLCIGLLQRELWHEAERWHLRVAPRQEPTVLLPDVSTLLARKLRPMPSEIADIAHFLLTPSPGLVRGEENYGEPIYSILRFLEKHAVPPARGPLRAALLEARRRLAIVKAKAMTIRHKSGGKAQTSRFDKCDARLVRLLDGSQ